MSFRENLSSSDNVAIKVKRANNNPLKKRVKNYLLGNPNSNPNPKRNLSEISPYSEGYLTAQYRKYNPDTGTYGDWSYLCKDKHNLLTNVGRVFFHTQMYGTSPGGNGANYIAVTTTAVTPAAADTTLTGEATTNGFSRVLGTVVLPTGSGTSTTVSTTFTATGAMTNVQASALFTAASSGTMAHEATFTATTFATNDQLQITWTLTTS